jgi:signal transduction histidine kinase/CheY-like chemotaxis protein/ABC-type amino acid transport substrate-binding protein
MAQDRIRRLSGQGREFMSQGPPPDERDIPEGSMAAPTLTAWFVRLLCPLWLAGSLLAAPAPRVVKVAAFPFAPGIFMDEDGKAKGFFVDMLQEVARRQNWELRFVPGTWAEGLDRAKSGEVDLLTSVAYTEERDRFLDYGKVSAFTVWSILYANPGVRIQSVLDVKGHRVGVMRNDMNGIHFRTLCPNFNVPCEFVEFNGFPEVLSAVAEGRVDAGVTVSTFGYFREGSYKVTRTPVVFNPFEIFFATAEGKNPELLAALDAYLRVERGREGSTYQQAIEHWLYAAPHHAIPRWVVNTGLSALFLLLASWAAVAVFRRQVSRATAEIRVLNTGLQQELAEGRRKEELIMNVASGVSATTGDSFFQDLVKYLARATRSDIALIGELETHEDVAHIRTLAVFMDGAPGANRSYLLAGSPCERVVQGDVRVYPDRIQQLFPADDLLRELGAESYVGAPLASSEGLVLGHLAVIGRRPLDHAGEVCSLLQIFSARAASELERRRNEAERLAFERKMQHAQKLESLGVLAGGIAHDFNNLLTAMLGHLNVAQAKLTPESPAQPHLHSLERIVHRTAELTRQMLAYSGKGRFVVKPHDLNTVIREMVHLLEVSVSKKIALRLHLADRLPPVQADAAQIQQVIMNLVTNASDAIGDQEGTIRIHTYTRGLDEAFLKKVFHNQDLEPGAYVIVEVSDTGCGMPPDVQARIFDPFFTTKVTGRGLGLSATIGILKGHRAGLKIYSEVGKGTTFKLFFPAAGAEPVVDGGAPGTCPPMARAGVLLVDDEEVIREAGKSMLESLGLDVLLASDGQQALDLIRRGGEKVDLVLMDITMPHMDGREAFLAIRALNPALPVILSSGYHEQETIQDFLGRGLSGFLQKPYTLQALSEALRGVMAQAPGR